VCVRGREGLLATVCTYTMYG